MSLTDYLNQRYRPATATRYQREWESFSQQYDPKATSRNEVLIYLDGRRKAGQGAGSLRASLAGLKAGFSYLLDTEIREDHPCRYLRLRDLQRRDVQLQDLFSESELESLLDYEERYQALKRKHKTAMSLLIYQGLSRNELAALELRDLDLEAGEVRIRASSRTNGRKLELKPKQVLLIYQYIEIDRKALLGRGKSAKLLITKAGTEENGEGIGYLLERQQHRFPNRKLNPTTVRMSVIANWLSGGMDLRKAQYLAGHKYPSSTERYRQTNLERLKESIEKFHPLQ